MNLFYKSLSGIIILCLFSWLGPVAQTKIVYDIVLTGGRVIDPETKLDAVRNVGILNNRIALVSAEPMSGKEMIDVSGLVVSPGFIDLHVHGTSNVEQEFQVHDGVTTALELEWGIALLEQWYASRKSKALINYGASVSWPFERFKAIDKYKQGVSEIYQSMLKGESSIIERNNTMAPSFIDRLTPEEMNKTLAGIKASLAEGGIGIGVPIGYLPKTNPEEMFRVFKLAGELHTLVFSHVREPNIISIQEAISDRSPDRSALFTSYISTACPWARYNLHWIWCNLRKETGWILLLNYIHIQQLLHHCKAPCSWTAGRNVWALPMVTCNGLLQENGLLKRHLIRIGSREES